MKHTPIKVMHSTKKTKTMWNLPASRQGYLDGLSVFSFIVCPYRPRAIRVPTVADAWRDVGASMSGALMEQSDSEKNKYKKTAKKQARAH